ncbi:MAG: M20/M25/M40 family metallo-hydrolase [Chloroflexi bacterium]|nr:M20/M25/M40 family metallo-hydrolase [Chloroflexota bacterium]
MLNRRIILAVVLIVCLVIPAQWSLAQDMPDFVTLIDADSVMQHVEVLSVDIGARPMGSEEESEAAEYIADMLSEWGYDVTIEEFETTPPSDMGDGELVTSRNVIAVREGDDQIVVVGAHMDSVTDGTGAGDNASGVAAILAAAEAISDYDTTHTLIFIAFGAEESGDPTGADMVVESLGDEIENVIAMINVDSVGVGTHLNVYAGAEIEWSDEDEEAAPEIIGGPTWVRDLALDLAAEMNLPFGTSPDDTWGGFTGDWSDHYSFVLEDIPIVYFEAWQWEGAEDAWWGQETPDGDVMHTPGDIFENVVPEKVEMSAELIAATAYALASGMAEAE